MNALNFLALTGAFGKAAKAVVEKSLEKKSPWQRRAAKLRITNEPCPVCRGTLNVNGRCYRRSCEAFAGNDPDPRELAAAA